MIDLRCPCGQRIGFRQRALGFAHESIFFDLVTDQELEICPECWSNLDEAFAEGDLVDVDALA